MKITYEDEYGEELFDGDTSSNPPVTGSSVIIDGEEWFVRSLRYYPKYDAVVVTVTDSISSKKKEVEKDDRIAEMQAAILDVRKRQDKQESRGRILREQLVTIRTHLRQRKPEGN